jgi:hypothetical protein
MPGFPEQSHFAVYKCRLCILTARSKTPVSQSLGFFPKKGCVRQANVNSQGSGTLILQTNHPNLDSWRSR